MAESTSKGVSRIKNEKSIQEFFADHPVEQQLYAAALTRIGSMIPGTEVQVQKTQIAFKKQRAFCWIWLPIRPGIKGRPAHYIILTFPYKERICADRIVEAVEAHPGQWTHHVIIGRAEELDEELLSWIRRADQWRNNPNHQEPA